jgi:site-specific recombinase XerD
VNELAEEYFALMDSLVATAERSQRTLDLYRQRYRTHIEPILGRKKVQDVRGEHVAAVYAKQRGTEISAWTISGTHTILSGLFRFALTRGYIATSPLDRLAKIEKPKQVTEREARRLSDEEIRKLCNAATPTYRPIITTLACDLRRTFISHLILGLGLDPPRLEDRRPLKRQRHPRHLRRRVRQGHAQRRPPGPDCSVGFRSRLTSTHRC